MKGKKSKPVNDSLAAALSFLSPAQNCKGAEPTQYCVITNHTAVAFDGLIACGALIQEEIEACPMTILLCLALMDRDTFAITQLPDLRLLVRSGEFQTLIPCCDRSKLLQAAPDALLVPVDDRLKTALAVPGALASEKAEKVLGAAVQLNSYNVVGCNNEVLLQTFHSFNAIPNNLLIPKAAVTAVVKSNRKLVGIGGSEQSVTFWFEGDWWIRTQIYKDGWPDMSALNMDMLMLEELSAEMPAEFWPAFKQVAKFSVDGRVYCGDDEISSHPLGMLDGAKFTMSVPGCPSHVTYSIKALKMIEKHCLRFNADSMYKTYFYGDNLRGVIASHGAGYPKETSTTIEDDEIPF